MKKLIFSMAIIAIMMGCMVACSNTTPDTDSNVNITTSTTVVPDIPELPELSSTFIETALQFIDEYSSAPSKNLENLAAEAIQQSNGYRDTLYTYLNWYLPENFGEEIYQFFGYTSDMEYIHNVYAVDVWIHNYDVGGDVGCVSFNGQDATYNYEHDNIILSAGVVGKKYPDNVTLAEARIASYVLAMSPEQVDCCIVTSPDGLKSYDFTFGNKSFKETAREILLDLLED